MATYHGLDPHDDNKWEEKAERFARKELSKWLQKKKLYLVFLIDSYKWFPFKTKRKE